MTTPDSEVVPWLAELRRQLGADRVSQAGEDLDTYSRDLWPRWLLGIAGRQPAPLQPGAVVWPNSAAEVQTVLRLCHKNQIAVVPYGAGSGVAGGAVGPQGSLVLDTKRMRAVDIDPARGVVSFEPGILGWHLEERLNRAGYTLGHFPSSIMCSTAGGWLATRGAGQCSTKYGKIEDMVRELELCTGTGQRLQVKNGDGGGTDWLQLIVGSEGTLGVITRATCSLRPLPATRHLRGFAFPSVEEGCRAIQHLMQLGLRPAVVRLYDELDTLISGIGRFARRAGSHHGGAGHPAPHADLGASSLDFESLLRLLRPDAERMKGRVERWLVQTLLGDTEPLTRIVERLLSRLAATSLLVIGFEGEPALVAAESAYAREQIARCGGRDLGEEPGQHWLSHRYNVSFKMSRAFAAGAFTDTIEVASTWDRLLPLYREVRAAVAPYALCMAHFSHAYPDGCSIYFTVMARRRANLTLSDDENRLAVRADQRRYDALWNAAMQATLRAGATISHHHGVGRLKAPHMPIEHGESLRILSALRSAADPQGICNPGNLAPAYAKKEAPPPARKDIGAHIGEPNSRNHLVEVECGAPLYLIERALRRQRLSIGGLPPWAWGRTLGEALASPRPSEASLESGRLRDRRLRLRAAMRQGDAQIEVVVPPQPVPRRATGPDLGHALLGQGEGSDLRLLSATLRLCPRLAEPVWLGQFYTDPKAALRALRIAHDLHGSAAIAEVMLVSRELIDRVLANPALPSGNWALIARAAGPEPVAAAARDSLLQAVLPDSCGELSPAACNDFWAAESVCGPTATAESLAAAARFPAHEQPIFGSTEELAALLAQTAGARLICGVYLHGAALCTDQPLKLPKAAHAHVHTDAAAVLDPLLRAALFSD